MFLKKYFTPRGKSKTSKKEPIPPKRIFSRVFFFGFTFFAVWLVLVLVWGTVWGLFGDTVWGLCGDCVGTRYIVSLRGGGLGDQELAAGCVYVLASASADGYPHVFFGQDLDELVESVLARFLEWYISYLIVHNKIYF